MPPVGGVPGRSLPPIPKSARPVVSRGAIEHQLLPMQPQPQLHFTPMRAIEHQLLPMQPQPQVEQALNAFEQQLRGGPTHPIHELAYIRPPRLPRYQPMRSSDALRIPQFMRQQRLGGGLGR